jgi:hypothetical protein
MDKATTNKAPSNRRTLWCRTAMTISSRLEILRPNCTTRATADSQPSTTLTLHRPSSHPLTIRVLYKFNQKAFFWTTKIFMIPIQSNQRLLKLLPWNNSKLNLWPSSKIRCLMSWRAQVRARCHPAMAISTFSKCLSIVWVSPCMYLKVQSLGQLRGSRKIVSSSCGV